ncbi:hypothetical protein Vadar_003208 [Vaccinium darrowii]|uniref:Uncharacterized protein n=1 Tax=Vaccinium darrowii TaxID=229202 RepID=A0ACB7WXQ1_9ERIC|nr:hypothetical protein Vadar_003208 [Vaccinium darrowii]
MERSGNNRKRAREEDHPTASNAKIKPDLVNAHGYYIDHEFEMTDKQRSFDSIFDTNDHSRYNAAYVDGEGLFDFPWLKEGVIFKAEDHEEESDFDIIFASSSTLHDAYDSKAEEPNLCQLPKLPYFDDDDKKKKNKINYEDELLLPSFKAGQLEGPDWISSSVFD